MTNKKLSPIHPGEILDEEFLKPMGISQYRLAKDINVPPRRINEIVHGKRSITADTALRLGKFFWYFSSVLVEPSKHDMILKLQKICYQIVLTKRCIL